MAQKRRQAHSPGGEPFDSHARRLGLGQSLGELRAKGNKGLFYFFFFFSFFLFFFFVLYHVFVVKYKKQHGALAMAETKL